MAEGTGRTALMIPLSNWLRGADALGSMALGADGPVPEPAQCQVNHDAERAAAYERGREEGVREAEEAWSDRLSAQHTAHEAQLSALRAEADRRLSAALANNISEGLAELRLALETAMSEILRPFLEDRVAAQATAELLALIEADLSQHADPPVEIRAPASLHDALHAMLQERNLACGLTVADDIRLIFAQGSRRYEVMAERWIETLRGDSP